jgi:AcrR family transcriptional regulator
MARSFARLQLRFKEGKEPFLVRRVARDRRDSHPTKTALLEAAVQLIDRTPVDQLKIGDLLAASKVSYGSLYPHFDDFPHLLEEALIAQFVRHGNETIEATRLGLHPRPGRR